jgi:hypothetical protein
LLGTTFNCNAPDTIISNISHPNLLSPVNCQKIIDDAGFRFFSHAYKLAARFPACRLFATFTPQREYLWPATHVEREREIYGLDDSRKEHNHHKTNNLLTSEYQESTFASL